MFDVQWYIDNNLTHAVHTSERRAFRGCRRRWQWIYNEKYYPLVTPEPLEFGVAFHKALEFYYQPATWHDKATAAQLGLVAFKQTCDAQYKDYKKLNGDPSPEVIAQYKARVELGLNMLRYYFDDVAPSYDNDWTPIEVEVAFEVPVKDPDTNKQLWCKCDRCWDKVVKNANLIGLDELYNHPERFKVSIWLGLPITYGGRLDALFQDNKHGRYYIVDWKTTSRILDESKESSFLSLEDQITSYTWALWTMGIPVSGFIYVEFKKAYPRPPEELSRPYKTRRYSTNKQFMTNVDLFEDTVRAYDPQAFMSGAYDEYLAWLRDEGPKFTVRHQIHRNENELRSAGINIALECMDITGSPRIYPQPGRFSCPTCLFQQPCISSNDGGDAKYLLDNLYEKRIYHYYETEPASTE
jgi:PD-(D/E)XK nuclease superfamily